MAVDLHDELLRIVAALKGAGIEYAVCGALAVAIHGAPRGTKDIDILIRDEDVFDAKKALKILGYEFDAGLITFDFGTPGERRLHRVSRVIGTDVLTLDLLVVTPSLLEVWKGRRRFDLLDGSVDVVSETGLIEMKRRAGRPIDIADITALESLDR